jgi:hypothetical protein
MNIQVTKGQFTRKHLALINDADSQQISCTFNGETPVSADANICSVSIPANDTIDFTGVNAGTCSVTVSATCAYTDPVTNQPVSAAKTITVTVTVVEPAATSMVLV